MEEEARENMTSILNESNEYLTKILEHSKVLNSLRNDRILDEDDVSRIKSKKTAFDSSYELVETLKKRDLSAIEKLIKVLMKSVQRFIGIHLAIKGECATVSRKGKADYNPLNLG